MSKPSQAVRRSRQRAIEGIVRGTATIEMREVGSGLYAPVVKSTGRLLCVPTTKKAAWEIAIRHERYQPRSAA